MDFAINHLAAWAYPMLLAVLPEWAAGCIASILIAVEACLMFALIAVLVAAALAAGYIVLTRVYYRFIA